LFSPLFENFVPLELSFLNLPLADEANMLMKWKEPGPAEPQLESLLAFLVSVSKEANLVHVYLATSDYFLANWLAGSRFDCFPCLNLFLCHTINFFLIFCVCRGIGRGQL
jgi:hypothetical protein